jgi:exonuclease SbcC
MILKHIKAKNFYSFKELDLNLLQFKNIVYVKGINRDTGGSNGSGKSSILEMIVFGLFGKTIRKSTEEALINCDSRKALIVELDVCKLGVGEVKIIRGKRPNILNFYLDGQDLTQENALKTQEKIEHTLGLSYKTFIASIVFGQHSDLEFLSATTEDKRIIIRNFLNLEEIFTWRDKIKDLKSEYNTNAKVAETIILELKSQEDKLKLKMVDIEPVHMPETIEEVLIRETLINKSSQDINKLKDEHEDLKIEEDKLFAQIKLGEYSIKDTCKTCKKVYIKKQTKTNLRGLQKKLNSTVAKINKISNSLYKMRAELTKLKSKLSVTQWHELKKKEDLFLSQKKIRDEYNEIHVRRQEQELKKNNLELNYEVMRFWEKAFSEQGLIKYFIRNILDYLNFKTNE